MSTIELILLAIGLSMDAFAVSVCTGLSLRKTALGSMLIVGLYFGVFQAVMPLIGYFLGSRFADKITSFDHLIVFVLLCVIGGKMIVESFSKEENESSAKEVSLGPAKMLPLALATSIDALAVGISFAFLSVAIVPAVTIIGVTTFLLSAAGIKIGSIFGLKFKAKAEIAGGVILILIGAKILLEHIGVLNL